MDNTPMDADRAEQRFAAMLDEAGLPRFSSTFHDPAILGEPHSCADHEPIHITVPGTADDPRIDTSHPGIVIHRTPPLHPDDLTVHKGIPVTSPSRTLIDLAEVMTIDELRATFARARAIGLLDPNALRASRARVEWRPSLTMLDEVIEEFCS